MSVNQNQHEINAIELYFEWYIRELKDNGYIKDFFREPVKMQTVPPATYKRYDFKKTKFDIQEFTLLQGDSYLFDYMIVWDQKAENIFYSLLDGTPIKAWTPFYAFINQEGNIVSLCDVKPPPAAQRHSGSLTTTLTFPLKQKIFWHLQGIYINKSVPIPQASKGVVKSGNTVALFTTTFVPNRYTFTDSGKQPRLIHYKTKSLNQYVEEKKRELAHATALLSVQGKLL